MCLPRLFGICGEESAAAIPNHPRLGSGIPNWQRGCSARRDGGDGAFGKPYALSMITALIRTRHGPEALAVTLSALVPAVTAGLVGDAVVLAEEQDEAIAQVAEAAGAVLVVAQGDSWAEGARVARRDWLLCLDAGDVPQEGWIRVLDRFLGAGPPSSESGRFRRPQGVAHALLRALSAVVRRQTVQAGDLIHRSLLAEGVRFPAPVRLPARVERDPAFG